ncbi:MAG: quinone-dependent dihydroorotate dehydrogenase [Balneolaceae bacterium]
MYRTIVRPLLFRFKADTTHNEMVRWGRVAAGSTVLRHLASWIYEVRAPELEQEILGMHFRNPVGLAAGFDKNGDLTPLMEAAGFGFVEVGSITANASVGNPLPRLFRLPDDQSLINRMGLNNDGADTIVKRLRKQTIQIPLGVNIAKTHDPGISGERALQDYKKSFDRASEVADYITINISCPNTREGKTFEEPESLAALLSHLQIDADETLPPVFVKLSSDLDEHRLEELIDVCRPCAISGYVAVNTSSSRDGLQTAKQTLQSIGEGGLSGRAIAGKRLRTIRMLSEKTRGEKPIIGVGGIFSTEDALETIRAGADLIQVYSGLVYEGPGLVRRINRGLRDHLRHEGLEHIWQIRSGKKP